MGFPANHPAILQAIERGLIRDVTPARPMVRTVPAPAPRDDCSEKEFQAAVVKLAKANGWRCYHTHDSRRSAKGFPDLVLVRPPVLILAELKTDAGKTTVEQDEWLELLRQVPGVRVRLWRPSLWAAVVAELTG